MDTIKDYVNNIFSGYPQDENNLRLKDELIFGMEDKYSYYISMGSSPDEALGKTFMDFGSIAELEENITKFKDLDKEIKNTQDPEYKENLRNYNSLMTIFPYLVALSVFLFLTAAGTFVYLESIFGEMLSIILFFALISLGVIILIICGMKKSNYERILGIEEKETKEKEESSAISSFVWLIAVCIFLFLGLHYETWHLAWIVFLLAAAIEPVLQLIYINKKKDI